jgi:hypothetical protein
MGNERVSRWCITDDMLEAGCIELFSEAPNYDLSAVEKRRVFAKALRAVLEASEDEDLRTLALSVSIPSSRL